jgi:protein gp37
MNDNLFPLPAIVRPAEDLDALAASIHAEHEASGEAVRNSLEHARCAGEQLAAARELCLRKQRPWLAWLEKKAKIPQRTAWDYMKIHQGWSKLADVANLGLREALNFLAQLEDEEEEWKVPEYVTVEEWGDLDDDQRRACLTAEGNKTFNSQGENENIKWALWSWNPVSGCLHDCPYCYARDIAERFYEQKFIPSLWPDRLTAPQNTHFPAVKAAEWIGHKNVFVCSMADLFGRWVPREWIEAVLNAVREAPQWNFLFLTKFPIRLSEFDFPDNAWVGTTVDCQIRVKNAERAFRKVKAGVKWLSLEPLLEPLTFTDLGAFDWIVLGGASKSSRTPDWRPPREWGDSIKTAARKAGVLVYEKTNFYRCIEQYPGVTTVEPMEAPESLRYLPAVE